MYIKILEELGLSKNEAKIYECLLDIGKNTVSEISNRSKIHRRNIYDSLNRLIQRGLVFQVVGHGDKLYGPVEPNKLMELVDEKRMKLGKIIPELIDIYQKEPVLEATYVYKGLEGFKNYIRDLLDSEEDAYFIGAKGAWFDPRFSVFLNKFLVDAKKRGITYHHLFDYEVKDCALYVPDAVGMPYKFLPKEYSTSSMVDIFGDRVVSFAGAGLLKINDDITIFVNISRPLATSYKTWFKFMFDMCPEIK